LSGWLLKAPQTSSMSPSILTAMRWTAPMNAFLPPPIIPMRSLRFMSEKIEMFCAILGHLCVNQTLFRGMVIFLANVFVIFLLMSTRRAVIKKMVAGTAALGTAGVLSSFRSGVIENRGDQESSAEANMT